MNSIKYFIALSVACCLLIGCKKNDDASVNSNSKEQKASVVAKKPETASFTITGMTCAIGCAKTIETKLSKMDGVQKATVDFDKKQATVDFDASVLTSEKLVQAVEATGDGQTYKVSEVKTTKKA